MTRLGLGIARVVVIVLILLNVAGMLFLAHRSVRPRNTRVKCMNGLREIGTGCTMYASDFGGYYPTVRAPGSSTSNPMASMALLYDKYVDNPKIFVCPCTTDNCADLQPGQSLSPHGQVPASGERRQCSYGYDDTRGPDIKSNIVIAADAPPAGGAGVGTAPPRNSDNHFGDGQNVLFFGGNRVIWATSTKNPYIDTDDIYQADDPANPGASDSYVHQ